MEEQYESRESTADSGQVTASAASRALAEVEKLLNGTPESEEEEEVLPPHGIYTDDIGREHDMDEIQAQGTFYVKPSAAFLVGLNVIVVPISGAVTFRVLSLLTFPLWVIPGLVIILTILTIAATAVAMFIAFIYCVKKTRGTLHSYKADGRAFYVTVRGKGKDQILYRDVLSVDYTPTKFLWFDRGYKVDILTTYGTVHYDYIFPYFDHRIIPKNLPFDVIKRNIRDEG